MHSRHHRFALAAGLAMLSACAAEETELQAAFDMWKANEPEAYVVQTCTLGISPPGCVRAAIEHGEVVLIEERIFYLDLGWDDFTEYVEGVASPLDSMFMRVIAGSEKGCRVEDYAYGADGYIDEYRIACDGFTQGRRVVCFQPGTLDHEACDVEPAP